MSQHKNQVFILFTGHAKEISELVTDANCTSVLIKGKNSCIIIDTRTAWDGRKMIAGKMIFARFFFAFFPFFEQSPGNNINNARHNQKNDF